MRPPLGSGPRLVRSGPRGGSAARELIGSPTDAPTSGDLWQAAADTSPDPEAVLDRTGRILAVNEAWRRLRNDAGRDDEVGEHYQTVCDRARAFMPEAADAADAVRRVLHREQTTAYVEYQLGDRWHRLTVRACSSAGAAALVRHEDVTDQRRSRREASTARSYLDVVTDSMGEGVFVLDPEGRVQMMNAAAEDMLGWSSEAIQGQVMHDLTHFLRSDGSDYRRTECPILNAYTKDTVVRVPKDTFIRRDGSRLPVAYTAAPLRGPDGQPGCVVVFMDATHLRAEEQRLREQIAELSWVRRVEDALEQERLRLYTQPIVRLHDGEVVQQELLLRVLEPDGRVSPPTPYLEAAERYGLVGRIDRWVIRRAIGYAAAGAAVEVNVSAASLSDAPLLREAASWLTETGADPRLVTFEITETAIISDESAARAFVSGLRDLGVRIALDDFGAGYGGFTYLKHLPVDFLKIDREFVTDLASNDRSRHVVQAVVNLAHGFGLQTVAEGVEDEDARAVLRDLGVDMAQGFLLGRPTPIGDLGRAGTTIGDDRTTT